MAKILMPKATAVWLVENTGLTFEQIADFCGLHPLEVETLAVKEEKDKIRPSDPLARGDLLRVELEKGEANPGYMMKATAAAAVVEQAKRKGPRYTPLSLRQERPDAIAWMLRNHPEVTDAQVAKLLGTTKNTIDAIRKKSHWKSAEIRAIDPVTLGFCTQVELDSVVAKAAEAKAKELAKAKPAEDTQGLKPIGADAEK